MEIFESKLIEQKFGICITVPRNERPKNIPNVPPILPKKQADCLDTEIPSFGYQMWII